MSSGSNSVAAWRALLVAHNRALTAIETDLRAAGTIPLTWYDVLLELNAVNDGLRMQELGERVVLSRTRVSRLVDELEAEGLVRRSPDPADGRARYAVITASGIGALKETAPLYLAKIEEHFTRHLTTTEQRAIVSGLSKVVAAHDGPPRQGQ
ncbi:MAG: MarR family transcriptional regulator [Actinobacteria bacterium]|nr:MarR family transcriptional regulator [Actinomycetota bacterium]